MNGSSQLCRTERCTEPPFCMVVRTEGCLRTELSAVRTDSYTGLCAAVAVRHSVITWKNHLRTEAPFFSAFLAKTIKRGTIVHFVSSWCC